MHEYETVTYEKDNEDIAWQRRSNLCRRFHWRVSFHLYEFDYVGFTHHSVISEIIPFAHKGAPDEQARRSPRYPLHKKSVRL